MIMIPEDDEENLTVEERVECVQAGIIQMALELAPKFAKLDQDLAEIKVSIRNIEIFNGATSQYLLKHLKYKKEEEAKE